jgi:hypothetical protein
MHKALCTKWKIADTNVIKFQFGESESSTARGSLRLMDSLRKLPTTQLHLLVAYVH